MKILYIAFRFHTNQIPIMHGWHQTGVETAFFAQYEGTIEEHEYVDFRLIGESLWSKIKFSLLACKYNAVELENKKLKGFVPSFFWLLKNIRSFSPDIVIIRERGVTCAVSNIVCKILGIKKVILYYQKPLADDDTFNNSPFKKLIKNIFFPKVIYTPVLYFGKRPQSIDINKQEAQHRYFVPLIYENKKNYRRDNVSDVLKILDVGKYREYKNHFFLIEALKKFRGRTDLHVTIIGQISNSEEKKYFDNLKEKIEIYGLEELVELKGNVSYYEMQDIYQQFDVLILPSKYESAGMVILEAMAAGMCVVSTINSGLACYLKENNCGYTFPVDNTDTLESIIDELVMCKNKAQCMGRKASQAVLERYSFKNYVDSLNHLLEKEFDYTYTCSK